MDCGTFKLENKGTYRQSQLKSYLMHYMLHVLAFFGHRQVYKVTKYLEERVTATVDFK
jgi:hypothetical protein